MADRPIARVCPRCGSDAYSGGGLTSSLRTCRECGTRYRPPTPAWERFLFGGVFIFPSLLGLGAAGLCLVLTLFHTPEGARGMWAFGFWCVGFLAIGSTLGLIHGVRELRGRRTTVPIDPVTGDDLPPDEEPAPDDTPRRARPARLVPAEQAVDLVREAAGRHGARRILRRAGNVPPRQVTNARAHFARTMADDEAALVLLDRSFLGNGKAGLLLTNRKLYSSWLRRAIALEDLERGAYLPPGAGEARGYGLLTPFVLTAPRPVRELAAAWRGDHEHRLFVNDQLVYAGGPVVEGFWMDALAVLAAAARQVPVPLRVTVLETFPQGAEGRVVANPQTRDPTWADVEAAIRALDGAADPAVRLWAGEPGRSAGLEVAGGPGRYALRELPDGWVYYDPAGGDEEVEVSAGEMGRRVPGYSVCADPDRVLSVARGFAESGAFE